MAITDTSLLTTLASGESLAMPAVANAPGSGLVNGPAIPGGANPGAGELFSLILAQLAEGQPVQVQTAQAAAPSNPHGETATTVAPSSPESTDPKPPSAAEQSVAASVLPLVVLLNPEISVATVPVAVQSASSVTTVPAESGIAVMAMGDGNQRKVVTPSVTQSLSVAREDDQSVTVKNQDVRVTAEELPKARAVSTEPQVAVPSGQEVVSKSPDVPVAFSITKSAPVHEATEKPAPSNDSPISLSPPVPDDTKGGQSTDHTPVTIALSKPATSGEQLLSPRDDQRDTSPLHQDAVMKQMPVEHVMPGTEKFPAEFVAPPAAQSGPPDQPVSAPKVAAPLPDSAPVILPARETLHLQFEPPALGRVTMQVSVQAQQVQATVGVEHRALGEFLTSSQGALHDALRQHGLRMEEFHVETLATADTGAGRTGLLDHGSARQDQPAYQRQELRENFPSVAVPDLGRNEPMDPMGLLYRINIFA